MKMPIMKKIISHPMQTAALLLIAGVLLLLSCKNDSYESGDSRFSYLRADFCVMHTSSKGYIDYLLLDAGDTVHIATPVALNWASTHDSIFRALVYYDTETHQLFSATPVLVIQPVAKQQAKTLSTDGITVESTWEGGGYFNVGFAVKTGQTGEKQQQQEVGLVLDTIVRHDNGAPDDVYLLLTHNQNGQPQYYTVRGYLSTPLVKNATYHLVVNQP